jgi:hypothetical protein
MKRNLLLTAIGLLVVSLALVWYLTFPVGLPIYLTLPGQTSTVERSICVSWYPPGSGMWWIIAERDGPLYRELHSATAMKFEIDVGSGLSDVQLGREQPYQPEPSNVVQALRFECSRLLVPRAEPSRLVAIELGRRS